MSKDFEQEAKKRGDDFSLQPREQVWQRIEDALDEKKRRGAAWWWWALPLVLLLGSGLTYYLYESKQPSVNITTTQTDNTKTENKTQGAETVAIQNDQPALPSPSITNDTPKEQLTQAESTGSKSRRSGEHTSHTIAHTNAETAPGKATVGNESNRPDSKPIVPEHVSTTPALSSLSGAPETPQVITGSAETNSSLAFNSQPVANSGAAALPLTGSGATAKAAEPANVAEQSKSTTASEATQAIESTEKIDSAEQVAATPNKSGVKPATTKKATWFVLAGVGKSHMGEFDLPGGEKALADPLFSSGGSSAAPPTQPKDDEAGMAYSLMVQRRQPLGKRWQWQAGLGWQYQQINQYLGNKVDSTIYLNFDRSLSNASFYRSGSNSSEKGINHRLLLSNDFSWQVLKNQQWLRLSGGLYTGFNIHNDYYIRDYAQRMIKNNELYSNWFIGFTPGIEFVFKNKLTIGAQTHFDFTKAYKELNSTPQYWRGWEIKAGISLFNK